MGILQPSVVLYAPCLVVQPDSEKEIEELFD